MPDEIEKILSGDDELPWLNDKAMSFEDIAFPKLKPANARLITSEIATYEALTIEQMAKGRVVKPFPHKYDFFATMSDLLEHTRTMIQDKKWDVNWLKVSHVAHMPINVRKDVYYIGSTSIVIRCTEPARNPQHDMRMGGTICSLYPGHWDIQTLKDVIKEFKEEQAWPGITE